MFLKFFLLIRNVNRNYHFGKNFFLAELENIFFFFFFFGFWSWLADKLFISSFSYEAGFYKPTVLKLHPPLCRITAHATVPGYFSTILAFLLLIQINGA
jgi:hypothetical protein